MNTIIKKKKKAFTLIELIIVLAIMAIIAAIAIPNFTAVRDNSKVKADISSCQTIQRAIMILVADGTITPATTSALTKTATFANGNVTSATLVAAMTNWDTSTTNDIEHAKFLEAIKQVKSPQNIKGVTYNATTNSFAVGTATAAANYVVTIDNNGNIGVNITN